jgi:hypothetical protein
MRFMELVAVEYSYIADPDERVLGFIAEDVPGLVATNDRRSLNPWDIISVMVPGSSESSGDGRATTGPNRESSVNPLTEGLLLDRENPVHHGAVE